MEALIFDLDGTLIDSVYAHVIAWQQALREYGFDIDAWRIHRRIGMSGDAMLSAFAIELDKRITRVEELSRRHAQIYKRLPAPQPHAGARKLLRQLKRDGVRFGIASSGAMKDLAPALKGLGISTRDIVVTRDDVAEGKPHADLFETCRERLDLPAAKCLAIGDAVWDAISARRAGMLFVGLASGGYGRDELTAAGAVRVYADAGELLQRRGELGLTVSG